MAAEIKVKLVRSRIGATPAQRKLLDALGLKRPGDTTTQPDNAATAGKIAKISHLVVVEKA